jgi:hypothetical protein
MRRWALTTARRVGLVSVNGKRVGGADEFEGG